MRQGLPSFLRVASQSAVAATQFALGGRYLSGPWGAKTPVRSATLADCKNPASSEGEACGVQRVRRGLRGTPTRLGGSPFAAIRPQRLRATEWAFVPTRDWCSPHQSHHVSSTAREPFSVVGSQDVGRQTGPALEPYPVGPAVPGPALGLPRFSMGLTLATGVKPVIRTSRHTL